MTGKFLTTHEHPPKITVDEKPRSTMGPIMGKSPAAKPLLQIHGLPLGKTAEERTAEILEKAKAARAKAKTAEAKKR